MSRGFLTFLALRDSGKKLICIDPMRSETVDFFGDKMEWVAPHMGTDVALMLGIAHTLVENGWHDEAFRALHHRLCRLRLLFAGRE